MSSSISVIFCLIATGTLFSMPEIPLAVSRKIKLKLLAGEGNINTQHVLNIQENPGMFFTVVQIGLNVATILDGIVGDTTFFPAFHSLFSYYMSTGLSEQLGFIPSFSLVTGMSILFTDLTPKCTGTTAPGAAALRIINPICLRPYVCTPLVWFFNDLANMILRILKLPMVRKNNIASDNIYTVVEVGALAGVLRKQEHELTEDVFELKPRTVPFSMTPRESVIWSDLHEDEQSLKNKMAEHPHSKFLVCNEDIDRITGYADSKDLLNRVLANQSLALNSGIQVRSTLIMPDTLALSKALESLGTAGEGSAVIMNEYALMVGIITLNDVMTTLMDDLVDQGLEEQTVARDEDSWLIGGGTPIDNVMRALDIDESPQSGSYETIGGFVMLMLRKIPKCTDSVKFAGYKFEVVDIDNYRIDQLLVTRIDSETTALLPRLLDARGKGESAV